MSSPSPSRRRFLAWLGAAAATSAPALDVCPVSVREGQAAALEPTIARVMEQGTTALLVVDRGCIAFEAYAPGWGPSVSQTVFSIGKSVTSTLVGVALAEGAIASLDVPIGEWLPRWSQGMRGKITVRHLLAMTSGLTASESYPIPAGIDPYSYLSLLPVDHTPGTRWHYDTQVYRLLFPLLEAATGESLQAYTDSRLSQPLGLTSLVWESTQDGFTTYPRMSAYDLARFGMMAAQNGCWEGVQIVAEDYLRLALEPSTADNPGYGLPWWLNSRGWIDPRGVHGQGRRWPDAPADTFAALGAFSKMLFVVPSRDVVVVRLGAEPVDPEAAEGEAEWENALLGEVLAAIEAERT